MVAFYGLDLGESVTKQSDMTLTSQSLDTKMLEGLIEALKAELRAKDEQLKAKDQQIAQLIQTLQAHTHTIQTLAAQRPQTVITQLPAPKPEPAPTEAPPPTPKPEPTVTGIWGRIRNRFKRS